MEFTIQNGLIIKKRVILFFRDQNLEWVLDPNMIDLYVISHMDPNIRLHEYDSLCEIDTDPKEGGFKNNLK